MEQLAELEEAGRVTRSRETPTFPDAHEPAALYLALAYTTRAPAITATDQHWTGCASWAGFAPFGRVSARPMGSGGPDCSGGAWIDFEAIKRGFKKDRVERFAGQVLALQAGGGALNGVKRVRTRI